jgi:tetratricopeptide (TPR) repeat protein
MKLYKIDRQLLLLIMLLLPLFSLGDTSENAPAFARGNDLYAKKQYEAALKVYSKIISEGQQSAALYYNTGNASFKTGDLPSALLYYEKAYRLQPDDADILANIRFANTRTTDKIEELPEFFLSRWWNSVTRGWSLSTLALFSLIFAFAGAALLITYFFVHQHIVKKTAFYASVLVFCCSLLTVFIGNRQLAYYSSNRQAIIFSSSVTVKAEPSENAKALFVVHEGTKITLAGQHKLWARVRLGNGTEGWMKQSDFKTI